MAIIGGGDRSSSSNTQTNQQVTAESNPGIILGAIVTKGNQSKINPGKKPKNSGKGTSTGTGGPGNSIQPDGGDGVSSSGINAPNVQGSGNVQNVITYTTADTAAVQASADLAAHALDLQAGIAAGAIELAGAAQQSAGSSFGLSLGIGGTGPSGYDAGGYDGSSNLQAASASPTGGLESIDWKNPIVLIALAGFGVTLYLAFRNK